MNIKFKYHQTGDIPRQFNSPNFYINNIETPYLVKNNDLTIAHLNDAKKINFFVGANNSGKSRFLRGIFNTYMISDEVYEENSISNLIDSFNSKDFIKNLKKKSPGETANFKILDSIWDKCLNTLKINSKSGNHSAHDLLVYYLEKKENILNDLKTITEEKEFFSKMLQFEETLCRLKLKINTLISELEYWHNNYCSHKTYIPPLRSLLKCAQLDYNSLSELTEKYLHIKPSSNQEIFTGLHMYDNVKNIKFSRESDNIKNFEKFLGDNFFDGSSIELVPDEKETKFLLIKIDAHDHRALNEIGDGIQALILLLYPIFTAKEKTWFFIEEPETHMHPGLQRLFIETLINDSFLKKKQLKYFFTTHSNHFLDLSLKNEETSIFQFKKKDENKHIINTNVKPTKDVLDLLGVRTSSVFLSNTSIWVEGPSDRKYLSKFLKLYCKAYGKPPLKEDIDYSFFEYGGNLLAHYLFDENIEGEGEEIKDKINSFALSNKIYLLADEDGATRGTKKGTRRAALENLSKIKENFLYQNTELREIENLLPNSTIKGFINQIVFKNNYDGLRMINFKKSDYNKIGIGDFYFKQFTKHRIPLNIQKAYRAESGTLKNDYKMKLCESFISSEITYEDLIQNNPILDEIIKKLYLFIQK